MRIEWSTRHQSVVALLLLAVGSVAATKSLARCPTDIAFEWAVAHSDSLPTTLGQMRTFPEAYQRVIMTRLPAKTQMKIWREHFSEFYVGTVLSASQKTLLRSIDDSLDSWLMHPSALRAALRDSSAMGRLIKSTFGDTLGRQLFASLGAHGKGSPSIQAASVFSAADAWLSIAAVRSALRAVLSLNSRTSSLITPPDCDCSTQSSWCSPNFPCVAEAQHCTYSGGGCGSLWLWPCNGMCGNEV